MGLSRHSQYRLAFFVFLGGGSQGHNRFCYIFLKKRLAQNRVVKIIKVKMVIIIKKKDMHFTLPSETGAKRGNDLCQL